MMFKAGDVVQLKSGDPLMIVTCTTKREDDEMFGIHQTAWVTWFDTEHRVCSTNFTSNLLGKVE